MKKLAIVVLLLIGGLEGAHAQKKKNSVAAQAPKEEAITTKDPQAEAILDRVSEKYTSLKSFKTDFTQTLETVDGEKMGTMAGEVLVKGTKFNFKLGDMKVICNGSTMWQLMDAGNKKEVVISDFQPEDGELTPNKIITLYKKGYKYKYMGELKDGQDILQIIDMEPEDRMSDIRTVRLIVNKADNTFRRGVVTSRGTNDRQIFEITRFVPNVPAPDTEFTFDKAKYPNVKVSDLRVR